MDLQELWQEHKRWILGVVAGLLLFWVGDAIVGAVFDSQAARSAVDRTARAVSAQEMYGKGELREIRDEQQYFAAAEKRLRDAMEFVPDDDFVLAGKGDPETYFPAISQRVRGKLLSRARELSVSLADRDLSWPAAVGREEIERTLLSLCLLEHAALRLLEAGEQVRREDPEALGLVSIDKLTVEKRAAAGKSRRGRRRDDGEAAADRIDELRVAFSFRCDVPTLRLFLDLLGTRSPSIGLATGLRFGRGEELGDPVLARGHFTASLIKDLTE